MGKRLNWLALFGAIPTLLYSLIQYTMKKIYKQIEFLDHSNTAYLLMYPQNISSLSRGAN